MASSSDGKSLEIPPDIFYEILLKSGVKDLFFLWIDCHQVSCNFKAAVEHIFITKHLKKTWIHIDPGKWYLEEHGKVFLATEFQISHLSSANLSHAIYKDKECYENFHKEFACQLKQCSRTDPHLNVQG
ncbi:uncharacterized protein BT62DRAFT_226402 [Guyanagaster necrorhizus]|uniref:Uncharacterized protein n=1 Tax=Guyanagaster necrorhizus TaxID=856835 RepID=A0A9P8AR36_9AGAR|nr:uncharacterized protein BT62DRAFT_226402 [Guyanagaster necrorhizus MCA 3950]KAG7444769.1 hypothetical protein BT62DRAFT_226402 [Guyanagaster necrorhizus MCA 3950]